MFAATSPLLIFLTISLGTAKNDINFSPKISKLTKLMIVNGDPFEASKMVEIFDLQNESAICPSVSDFPFELGSSMGTFIDGSPLVCGGYNEDRGTMKACYSFDLESNSWAQSNFSMTRVRDSAAAVLVSDKEWWVTGGYSGAFSKLASTELLTIGNGFERDVDLPTEMDWHHVVKVADDQYIFVGGYPHEGAVYFYDRSDELWSPLEPFLDLRHGSYAGLVTREDGSRDLVLAGGYHEGYITTTEILSLKDLTWRPGPDLPYGSAFGTSVQLDETFLAVGGYRLNSDGFGYNEKVFRFDTSNNNWTELQTTLKVARRELTSIALPSDYITCT